MYYTLQEDRGRMQDDAGIGATLVRNDVIASPRSTMRELLDYLHENYGDIEGYLKVSDTLLTATSAGRRAGRNPGRERCLQRPSISLESSLPM
jgi:hypothetical protein